MKTTILLLAGTVTALSTVACNSQQPDTTMERIHSEEVDLTDLLYQVEC
jgi:hypothetical protein